MAAPRVLVVDDEQPLARILSFALQNEGFSVEVATDGIDCMNKISAFEPDAVLMDIMMPRLDGIETIRLLRQNRLHRDIVIIAVSAKASPRSQQEALDAGADLFVKKPFQVGALIQTVVDRIPLTQPPRG